MMLCDVVCGGVLCGVLCDVVCGGVVRGGVVCCCVCEDLKVFEKSKLLFKLSKKLIDRFWKGILSKLNLWLLCEFCEGSNSSPIFTLANLWFC